MSITEELIAQAYHQLPQCNLELNVGLVPPSWLYFRSESGKTQQILSLSKFYMVTEGLDLVFLRQGFSKAIPHRPGWPQTLPLECWD